MNRFHPGLHSAVMEKLAAAGVNVILGQRVKMPSEGDYPVTGPSYNVELADGRLLPADVAVRSIYPHASAADAATAADLVYRSSTS
jgi:hypothetical protein